jgi:hypothetical protein
MHDTHARDTRITHGWPKVSTSVVNWCHHKKKAMTQEQCLCNREFFQNC